RQPLALQAVDNDDADVINKGFLTTFDTKAVKTFAVRSQLPTLKLETDDGQRLDFLYSNCVNNRRFNEKSLPGWVKSLPIGHLQLGGGRLSDLRRNSSTIGNLFDAVQRGALSRSSPTAVARIKRTLNLLTKALKRANGSEGWDLYRKARPPFRSYKA